jgi:hypothetical protein
LSRNLSVTGNGGWQMGFSDDTGNISGDGGLIITVSTSINPTADNTYSGTTHVWNNVGLGTANGITKTSGVTSKVLGTGNLRVEYFGHAWLYASTNIDSAATVFVGSYDVNTEFPVSATRATLSVCQDFMPNITSDSGGNFNIDCTTANGGGGNLVTALSYDPANPNKVLGNGYMSIGTDIYNGFYQGGSLITDADHVYRFSISANLTLNSWGGPNGALNDNGGNSCGVYIAGGGSLSDDDSNNTYSGTTTVDQASGLYMYSLSTVSGQSPMGAATGNGSFWTTPCWESPVPTRDNWPSSRTT